MARATALRVARGGGGGRWQLAASGDGRWQAVGVYLVKKLPTEGIDGPASHVQLQMHKLQ